MENIIKEMIMDSVKETIKDTIEKDNTICKICKNILKSIAEEAKEDKRISVYKVQDLLIIQNLIITAHGEELASKSLSKEQLQERIAILKLLQEMTKSLFDDALNALNKRIDELNDKSINNYKDLSKEELIELLKQKEQK